MFLIVNFILKLTYLDWHVNRYIWYCVRIQLETPRNVSCLTYNEKETPTSILLDLV